MLCSRHPSSTFFSCCSFNSSSYWRVDALHSGSSSFLLFFFGLRYFASFRCLVDENWNLLFLRNSSKTKICPFQNEELRPLHKSETTSVAQQEKAIFKKRAPVCSGDRPNQVGRPKGKKRIFSCRGTYTLPLGATIVKRALPLFASALAAISVASFYGVKMLLTLYILVWTAG